MWINRIRKFYNRNTAIISICILILFGVMIISSTFLVMLGIINIDTFKTVGIIAVSPSIVSLLLEIFLGD